MFELTNAVFHGIARLVPRRGVGPGIRTLGPVWKDRLDTPPRQPRAEGVAVIDLVRDQMNSE